MKKGKITMATYRIHVQLEKEDSKGNFTVVDEKCVYEDMGKRKAEKFYEEIEEQDE